MNRLRVLLVCIPALFLMGQGYNVPFSPPAAAGGTTPLHVMNFDDAGCEDSTGTDTAESSISGSATCDCDTEDPDCPLDGSLSLVMFLDTDEVWYEGDTPARNTGIVTLDYTFLWSVDNGGTIDPVISLIEVGGASPNLSCRMRLSETVEYVDARTNGGADGDNITIALNTKYWARLNYDIDADDCTLYVWSDTWGGTELANSPSLGDSASAGDVLGWEVDNTVGATIIFDDIAYCLDDLNDTTVQCGD